MSVYAGCFSPTGGTEKVLRLLAAEFGDYKEIDLSRRDLSEEQRFEKEDLCLIGVPSYGGRVPETALSRMESFQGNGAKAVLVAVYGNRAYEDTLIELQDFLFERGFLPAAGVAAIAEHSIMHQFAAGRPDAKDQESLRHFVVAIKDTLSNFDETKKLSLPGNHSYREYNGLPLKPKASAKCDNCGVCAAACPVAAIPKNAPYTTDTELCISCMRCVSICPKRARKVSSIPVKLAASKMKKVCSVRKDNELFLPE